MVVLRLHVDVPWNSPGHACVGHACVEHAECVPAWLQYKVNPLLSEKVKKKLKLKKNWQNRSNHCQPTQRKGKKEQNNFFIFYDKIQTPTQCAGFFLLLLPPPPSLMDNLKMAQLEIFHVSRKAPGTSEDM